MGPRDCDQGVHLGLTVAGSVLIRRSVWNKVVYKVLLKRYG